MFPLDEFTYEFRGRPQPPAAEGQRQMYLFHMRRNQRIYFDKLDAASGECLLVFQNNVLNDPRIRLQKNVPCDQWHHVAATHGAGSVILYVDGVRVDEVQYDQDALGLEFEAYTWEYHVGGWYGREMFFRGDLGPFRLHTRELTADEVARAYRSGCPAPM